MGVLGELFPGPKISDEAGESGDGELFRLGPIDLDHGVVHVVRAGGAEDVGTAIEGVPADAPTDGGDAD
ncbi:hypothetical protein ACL02T_28890 [Pseudonocardia sp. RS010]|uniref:hypothetical protein n=1 Tax=Pseudonocardia sp. RS010 TaxID=3385979 RepID=UPI0039A1A378